MRIIFFFVLKLSHAVCLSRQTMAQSVHQRAQRLESWPCTAATMDLHWKGPSSECVLTVDRGAMTTHAVMVCETMQSVITIQTMPLCAFRQSTAMAKWSQSCNAEKVVLMTNTRVQFSFRKSTGPMCSPWHILALPVEHSIGNKTKLCSWLFLNDLTRKISWKSMKFVVYSHDTFSEPHQRPMFVSLLIYNFQRHRRMSTSAVRSQRWLHQHRRIISVSMSQWLPWQWLHMQLDHVPSSQSSTQRSCRGGRHGFHEHCPVQL